MQLACFTVAALAVAGLTTRFALPALMERSGRDCGASGLLDRLWNWIAAVPRVRWAAVAIAVLSIGVVALAPHDFWENDLAKLTPVPRDLLLQDQRLRAELGTADVRYMLVIAASGSEQALKRLEALDPSLRTLVERGVIGGYDHAARYIPSADAQLRRQRDLPVSKTLREDLGAALAQTPFRANAFEPFVHDVEQARSLPPLTIERMRASPWGASVEMLITQRSASTTALVTFSAVKDVAALQAFAASAGSGASLLDTKGASEALVADQRTRILWTLAAAAFLLVAVVAFALRSRSRVYRVLAPMALTTLIVLAVLRAAGVSLNLFHLIALILAAGLGLDYALFFEHAATDRAQQRRTLHAILVCALSTLLVFALLALSDIPVLRAIGITVSLGVVSNFVLSLLLTRPGAAMSSVAQTPSLSSLIPHQGAMCLLERLIEWDEQRAVLETDTHRSPTNPLLTADKLRAIHLCEYGAQAIAVHGALRTQAGERPAPGMLVSLREVKLARDYVHDLPSSLRVEAECLHADRTHLQYRFSVTHCGEVLAAGRAVVMLRSD
jgi:predicted exporter/predicted hotdog family 3-hydroxylacyl-ACP dehydratase